MFKTRRSTFKVGLVAVALIASLGMVTTSTSTATAAPPPCQPDEPHPTDPDHPPLSNAPFGQGTYFSYPNRSGAERVAIRNRVISTINSTWGRYYTATPVECTDSDPTDGVQTSYLTYRPHQGTIKLTTWSMNDWGVRDALVRAVQRGANVRIIAAQGVNATNNYQPWKSIRTYLRSSGVAAAGNWAWECTGACRGSGGTPHSKFFLFTDVGTSHIPTVSVQSSMNLTAFAYNGQWNSAVATYDAAVYNRFAQVFNQMAVKQRHGLESGIYGTNRLTFYPGGGVSTSRDAVLNALSQVRCTNAGAAGIGGRTRIRAIQYALFDTRGVAIAKRMRALWNSGCNVSIIYSVTSRPVLKILRARSGRGPVPMRQSVIKNRAGDIVKYNHSKWLGIGGNYGGRSNQWIVQSGSANWSNFAYGCDEQMMQTAGAFWAGGFFRTFDTTWRQPTSRPPKAGGGASGARLGARVSAPTFGYGIYKYMETD